MFKFICFILVTGVSFNVQADNEHHHHVPLDTTIPKVTNVINKLNLNRSGIALSLGASAIDCSYTTKRWQFGGGLGVYRDDLVPVIGGCKKFNGTLIKGTLGKEGSEFGGNIGVMFTLD